MRRSALGGLFMITLQDYDDSRFLNQPTWIASVTFCSTPQLEHLREILHDIVKRAILTWRSWEGFRAAR